MLPVNLVQIKFMLPQVRDFALLAEAPEEPFHLITADMAMEGGTNTMQSALQTPLRF